MLLSSDPVSNIISIENFIHFESLFLHANTFKMNTINNLLEFQMLILENVFENDLVFRKELKKSKKWLNVNDLITLKKWLLRKFSKTHSKSIHEELKEIPV
jgi:hypothetical protein